MSVGSGRENIQTGAAEGTFWELRPEETPVAYHDLPDSDVLLVQAVMETADRKLIALCVWVCVCVCVSWSCKW